jgi:SAM-dependent methyltransferase
MSPEYLEQVKRNLENIDKQTDVWPLCPPLSPEEFEACKSEIPRYRHLISPYCMGKSVLDIGSQGDPVVPWAVSFDLPEGPFLRYSGGVPPLNPIHLRGYANDLSAISSGSFDVVLACHILEDFPLDGQAEDESGVIYPCRREVIREWARVLKPNGLLIILVPEYERWKRHIECGGKPNCSHRGEPRLGELTEHASHLGLTVIEERFTNLSPTDYSILFVGRKPQ